MAFGDASDAVATLVARISAFQNGLDADHELAMAVPGHAPVRIDVIEFTTGDLVTLRGVTPAGERAEIVHHISQTNLMLVARQKQGPRARRIDFQFTKPALAPGEALGPSRRR